MKVYLAGLQEAYTINYDVSKVKYALWSFPYSARRKDNHLIQPRENLIMDSGAFTFLNSQGTKGVNLDDYVVQYAEYLKTHSITQYIEMDVDSVTGYEKVKEYRRYLEKETNLPCIPVWHKSRGLDDFHEMIKDHEYVAIGGIVTREIKQRHYPYLKTLISAAHERGVKIHGLGFTRTELLPRYKWDSVDSTSWVMSAVHGGVQIFTGKKIEQMSKASCLGRWRPLRKYNLDSWIAFQDYADKYL